MYGLPKDFDPSPFIGQTLQMVCFNASQIYLHFDKQTRIAIESALIYQTAKNQKGVKLSPPVGQTDLPGLVGHDVARAAKEGGSLLLTFDNGHIVECVELAGNYESYQITLNGKIIVV